MRPFYLKFLTHDALNLVHISLLMSEDDGEREVNAVLFECVLPSSPEEACICGAAACAIVKFSPSRNSRTCLLPHNATGPCVVFKLVRASHRHSQHACCVLEARASVRIAGCTDECSERCKHYMFMLPLHRRCGAEVLLCAGTIRT